MDYLKFAQFAELMTLLLLLMVLNLLYFYGKIRYISSLRLAFGVYFLLNIMTYFGLARDGQPIESFYVYFILVFCGLLFYRALIEDDLVLKHRLPISIYLTIAIIVPVILIALGRLVLLEGSGYIILGGMLVVVGIRWYRNVLPHLISSRLSAAMLILYGLHLMDFIIMQNFAMGFVIGYGLAAGLIALLTFFLTFMHFSRLNELDQLNYSKYMNLFNNSTDPILLIEGDVIYDCNNRAMDMFECGKEEIVGKVPMDLSPAIQENGRDSYEYGDELFNSAKEGKVTIFDWIHASVKGREYLCEISLFRISNNQFASIIRDMTDKYAYEEELNFHKYYDALTHLPKRELFVDRLSWYLDERYQEVGLIAFNIDNFKEINDQYGHSAGDEVLKMVTERIFDVFNKEITMTRLGGDEFIAIMDRLGHRNRIYIPVERIESVFAQNFEVKGNSFKVSVCIGVAFPEGPDSHPMELLKNADFALNTAKSQGRGRLEFYSSGSKEEFTKRINIEKDMRHGIEVSEFIPYYQPIVDPLDGRIIGAEALARWKKSDGTMVYPDVFIPVAEETEMIHAIGKQIMTMACRQCTEMLAIIPDFTMHVNLSPLQLKKEATVLEIRDILEKSRLTARHLSIELTESALIQEQTHANKILNRIRELGVGVALDDFGTGYSSLSYLSEMNVDTVKIDRSFVIKLPGDPKAKAMIGHMTELLQELNYRVVVEGVEEKDQAEYLISLGCNAIQGYYYHRPMPYEQFMNLLQEGEGKVKS